MWFAYFVTIGQSFDSWKLEREPHTAAITTAWLRRRRVRVLNWPASSPNLSPIENIWHIVKWKIRQRQPRTLQQLETYIRQEWVQIPTPKLQKLITLMPRRLQTVLKRRGDATPWQTWPCPNYFETCSRHQIWNELILCKFFFFLSLNIYVICVLLCIKLAHVIRKYFSFNFIQIKHFQNSGCNIQ